MVFHQHYNQYTVECNQLNQQQETTGVLINAHLTLFREPELALETAGRSTLLCVV